MKSPLSKQSSKKGSKGMAHRVARFLASRTVFILLLTIGLCIVGWLIWQRAIGPLRVEAGLPAGIPAEIVRINTEAAQVVGQTRSERGSYTVRNYTRFIPLFASPAPIVRP